MKPLQVVAYGQPAGVTATLDPAWTTSTSTLTYSAAIDAAPATTWAVISAVLDSDMASMSQFTMTVMDPVIPVYDVVISPQYLSLPRGGSAQEKVTVNKRDGFSGAVSVVADLTHDADLSSSVTPDPGTGAPSRPSVPSKVQSSRLPGCTFAATYRTCDCVPRFT